MYYGKGSCSLGSGDMILLRFPSREAMQAYFLTESLKAIRREPPAALFAGPMRQETEEFYSSESCEYSILGKIYSP